ncbi:MULTISPECIES: TetR/AcrR family transcriptional regulator [Rhodococcus]|jgi:AcrR family transcriptional regulator|uniref:TetR/AcrR family transcriptional regulator n=1 Tax=Rhodococcus oxybenzonivorans TaxID=1990687 RepID=A0AAE4UWF2_9NOCA|nr:MULTISPECIES: TetR/AcrR family transcriptional regulator [Rhodococcus]MDV7243404.1 TetR/AcrR family transcriptional regulator [Rhodococcus oxybenzonivorans]MDV7263896.1 TetR/AcrR family transcriptional regulator [Rhodococcus oxybenzonivorans]MDV7276830.1 TetR/AcrR family transcriptional regulator [Rhodococcus oxybenzonivorans]MDV7334336.1 TetR/AcrR family transcriptional regulator [Rhodococcus oxybenzonivorans]MDV7344491.1 TetR/AcrR family transcriptional regulator [Rhodococcus oxybenzonivo
MSTDTEVRRESPRSKRSLILSVAIDQFGKVGYEHTKWASIADEVGIGQTALYHYFESKAHCLLTIMRLELADSAERFTAATAETSDPVEALRAAVAVSLEASPTDALQRRILQNHMDLLATERQSVKEEAERLRSRELVAKIEQDWTDLITRGIKSGDFVDSDAHLQGRLVLALVISVWRWYRPGGKVTLDEITALVTDAALRVVRA